MDDEGIPESVQTAIFSFHDAITDVEEKLGNFLSKPLEDVEKNFDALSKARIELMSIFAANSLYWMYLCTRGESPTEHPILDELKRVKTYMDRLKEIEDRAKAPKLNKRAAKGFVRNALWQPNGDSDKAETINGTDKSEASSSHIAQEFSNVLRKMKASSSKRNDDEEKTVVQEEDNEVTILCAVTKKKEKKDKGKKKKRPDDFPNGNKKKKISGVGEAQV